MWVLMPASMQVHPSVCKAHRGQKSVLDPLKLELWTVISLPSTCWETPEFLNTEPSLQPLKIFDEYLLNKDKKII